jgi:hypothetical protein
MLLKFRCNFARLKDDLHLSNVPQTCAWIPRILDSTCTVVRGLENKLTTPRATFKRSELRLQSNLRLLAERTQFRRNRVIVPIARKHLLSDPPRAAGVDLPPDLPLASSNAAS